MLRRGINAGGGVKKESGAIAKNLSHTRARARVFTIDRTSLRRDLQSRFFFLLRRGKPASLVFPRLVSFLSSFFFSPSFSSDVTGVDASIYKARSPQLTHKEHHLSRALFSSTFFPSICRLLPRARASSAARKKALTIIGTFSIWIDGVNFAARARGSFRTLFLSLSLSLPSLL